MLKKFLRSERIARILVCYLRFVYRTSRIVISPTDAFEIASIHLPAIFAIWHGKSFMAPFIRRPGDRIRLIVSLSQDGVFFARIADQLHIDLIRGSTGQRARHRLRNGHGGTSQKAGTHDPYRIMEKQGHIAAWRAIHELNEGCSVAMTVNEHKNTFVAGLGVISIARLSGRSIIPTAAISTWRIVIPTWDKTEIPLPFGRLVFAFGDPIYVPETADHAAQEIARLQVQNALNSVSDVAKKLARPKLFRVWRS